MTTGHQVAESRGRRSDYLADRSRKLVDQAAKRSDESKVLSGTKVYINGYLRDTTDIEMKRTLTLAGAQVL